MTRALKKTTYLFALLAGIAARPGKKHAAVAAAARIRQHRATASADEVEAALHARQGFRSR